MGNNIKVSNKVSELFESIKKDIEELETKLKLEKGFFFKIANDDDWSFIIKLHAMVEAAVSHLLTEKLGKDELSDVFAQLEMSNTRSGKIVFIEALRLLDKDDRRFVRKLSELRNKLVHDVSNVSFDITEMVKNFDKQQREEFVKAFSSNILDLSKAEIFLGEPKNIIIIGAMKLMLSIYGNY